MARAATADGGAGGDVSGAGSVGGLGNFGTGSAGGKGGAAGHLYGGGLTNAGTVSFTGVTVNFTANEAAGNDGGDGGDGGGGFGGKGGNGASGNNGGNGTAGNGGDGGGGGGGLGGGIANFPGGDAHHRAQVGREEGLQAVESHEPHHGQPGRSQGRELPVAPRELPQAGAGGSPNGAAGLTHPGNAGATALSGTGIGGGLDLLTGGTVVIDNTTITGNTATTSDNDVFGTFTN